MAESCNSSRILLIGKVWPEPSATAAGRRTLDIFRALVAAGHELHFATAAVAPQEAFDLSACGVDVHRVRMNHSSFDDWICQLDPAVVIFDRFMTEEQFGWRVERNVPTAMRVLDTSDLHCLRKAREKVVLKGEDFNLLNETAIREIASIFRCDLSLMISEYEVELLQEVFGVPDSQLAYWPFFLQAAVESPTFEERTHCLLIGSFLHAPNLDAARWCAKEIWPRVQAMRPRIELHLYGSYGDQHANEFHRPQKGIFFKGRAEDALKTMKQYRLNLAPLRFGAGLKGKLFDGFETGTPSVVTPIAVEGIVGESDWGHHPTMDPQVMADTIVRLYEDKSSWLAVQKRSRHIAETRFCESDWLHQLPKLLDYDSKLLEERRHQQFLGRMLRHHQHRSTEFMGRWIETKERLQS